MANELTIFKTGAIAPSSVYRDINLPTARLDDGTGGAPFARVAFKGKDWTIKHGSKIIPVERLIDGRREKNPNLDVVILSAANHPSRRWYKTGYQDGNNNAPDCYSTGGFKPDTNAADKQDGGRGCLLCPHSGWGSKEGSKGKACSEYKNLAVVPVGDIENKVNGGPMLLAVPPNSLKPLAQYQMQLGANSLHYAQVHTRITFGESLFQFDFDAMAALDDVQATQVGRMLNHPLIPRILDEEVVPSGDGEARPTANIHVLQRAEPKQVEAPKALPAPVKNEAADEIAQLKAKLAALQAPEPEPEPELTAEQKEIAELKAQLAAAAQPKGGAKLGRPRGPRTPAVAPANMDSEQLTEKPVEIMAKDLPVPGNDDPIARINQTLSKAKELI